MAPQKIVTPSQVVNLIYFSLSSAGPDEANLCWSGRLQRGWVFGGALAFTLKDYFSLPSWAAI